MPEPTEITNTSRSGSGLFNWLRSSFLRKRKYQPSLTRIKRAACREHAGLYRENFSGERDGVIIEDFMSREEVEQFRRNLGVCTQKYPELVEIIDNGYTFGKTFFDIPEEHTYKSLIPRYESIELELFGFSLKERFLGVISDLEPGTRAVVATHPDNTPFLSNTIRVLTPGKGGLYIHFDLQVHKSFIEAGTIMSQIDRSNLLSFFVMLQKPETGGRLLLYDHIYTDTPDYVYAPGEKNTSTSIQS